MITITVLALSGCATNASVDNMMIRSPLDRAPISKELQQNIMVDPVSGGTETNPLWISKINDKGFEEALIESLEMVNLYNDHANYKLNTDFHGQKLI